MTDPGRVVVIGGGPTGLGAAHRLREVGHSDYTILERSDTAGGLASSFVDDRGFTWDIGGHVQFSHYSYYDRVLDGLGLQWLQHERESWVWIRKRFVAYPFQNNIHRLDQQDRDRILESMEKAAAERKPDVPHANFERWIVSTFGDALAEFFLVPYNTKVWGYPPEMLGVSWMGERVAVPDTHRIRRNIREQRDDVSWGPNNLFRFPLYGGTGAIWRALASSFDSSHLRLRASVRSIDAAQRRVVLTDGETLEYDTLVSSVPLPELTRLLGDGAAAELVRAADSLVYSSSNIFGVGLRGGRPPALARKCWMYFPEPHSPYYRVTVFSNYSPRNVPDGDRYWSLMAEVCETAQRPVNHATLFDEVIAAMRCDGLIEAESDIVSRWTRREHYGYPTPSVLRDEALGVALPLLEDLRIFSRGRFGAWKYEVSNQDHSFMQGVELVDRLVGKGDEPTLNRPDYTNSGVFRRE